MSIHQYVVLRSRRGPAPLLIGIYFFGAVQLFFIGVLRPSSGPGPGPARHDHSGFDW